MENLLNVAFDNLSHSSVVKNGKGLRQIEGLLAQICFSSSLSSSQYSSSAPATNGASLKPLDELADDLVFREFFRLQEGFEWNGMVCLPANDEYKPRILINTMVQWRQDWLNA